ncbi:hypothetical protein MKEN_00560200 [Mycena kentingensis (nom. inval.)]|nr:hypothetical protein MKEN_00560200 [Mycena kentingensis (nom. inval.)]
MLDAGKESSSVRRASPHGGARASALTRRTRSALACLTCRKRKRRCVITDHEESCTLCGMLERPCIFPAAEMDEIAQVYRRVQRRGRERARDADEESRTSSPSSMDADAGDDWEASTSSGLSTYAPIRMAYAEPTRRATAQSTSSASFLPSSSPVQLHLPSSTPPPHPHFPLLPLSLSTPELELFLPPAPVYNPRPQLHFDHNHNHTHAWANAQNAQQQRYDVTSRYLAEMQQNVGLWSRYLPH